MIFVFIKCVFGVAELAGISRETVHRLIPEHARKQNLFMALNIQWFWEMLRGLLVYCILFACCLLRVCYIWVCYDMIWGLIGYKSEPKFLLSSYINVSYMVGTFFLPIKSLFFATFCPGVCFLFVSSEYIPYWLLTIRCTQPWSRRTNHYNHSTLFVHFVHGFNNGHLYDLLNVWCVIGWFFVL